MQQVVGPHIIWVIALTLTASVLALMFISLIFAIVMHNILYRRLDPILFREPWFTPAEMAMYSSWPLSLIKSVIYMFLLSYPDYVQKKKRFRDLEEIPSVSQAIKIASKIYTVLHLLMVLVGVSWLLFIFGVYAKDNWL